MPVELLVGVLLFSAIVNVALLFGLSRADNVKIHWPGYLQTVFDSRRGRPPVDDVPTRRRRSLFVAGSATVHDAEPSSSVPCSFAPVLPTARTPLAETLPPDLAELLSRPASIAPQAEGFGFTPAGIGADRRAKAATSGNDGGPSILARLPAAPHGGSTALTLDPLTGLEGPASWSRIMETENARLLRYRRSVTVVMAEVEGLRRLAERLGDEPVDRLLPVIADAFRREARSSDWVARVGNGRFAAFLPETDEIQAINYVERIRLVCEPWLTSSAVPLRLAIGWSSPTASSDLEFALQRAEERMHSDRRMPGKSIQPPRVAPARIVSVPPTSPGSDDSPDEFDVGVPPAETGRFGEWMEEETYSEDANRAPSGEVSSGKGRRRSSRAITEPDRRADV